MDHAQRIGPHVEFINALLSLELSFSGNGFVMAMTTAQRCHLVLNPGPRIQPALHVQHMKGTMPIRCCEVLCSGLCPRWEGSIQSDGLLRYASR
ncbi:hypothetical protein HaLaN_28414 [Haematococcus lacustris]|uniref:Uncharacterized protein n=1 Tax=Haematococcus lacustris TaxID=44745 RepID=A0A6A0AAF0_HAELA|nr:hypothetical protein HaLaN_28414 [Haematococcus lacustris]